jgi:hypothetical protein
MPTAPSLKLITNTRAVHAAIDAFMDTLVGTLDVHPRELLRDIPHAPAEANRETRAVAKVIV